MIPLRVRLKGFLCYKDEQEVSFDGSSLWMLSGLNGSGKSAVFDALTYSLFGHHRGGSVQAQELVNKNSDGFEVEFDFLQEGQAYRIRRTLKRKARGGATTTQQIFRRASRNGDATAQWEALADTSKRAEFDEWVRNNIGLTYETFTSSVLLLQGKAERLLDSTAKGRFEVLAGIVDLGRYQRLHERADARRKEQEYEFKALEHQLGATPAVSAMDLLEAEGALREAEACRQQAQAEVERTQALEYEARQCEELGARLQQVQGKIRATEGLLADAAQIERDEARLKELQSVLPAVKNAMEQRRGLEDARRRLAALAEEQQRVQRELAQNDEELQKARQRAASIEAALQKEDQQLRDVNLRLREATGQLAKLKEYERQEQDLARLRQELQRVGDHAAERVQEARERYHRLAELAVVVPRLTRLAQARQQLRQAVEQEASAGAARQQIESTGKQFKVRLDKLKAELDQAGAARQQTDESAAQARTLRSEAKKHLEELTQLSGSKVCRHCGQELTPAHLEDETVRRRKRLAEAEAQHRDAAGLQQEARKTEERLQHEFRQLDQQTREAREEYARQRERAEQARKDVERLQAECRHACGELPAAYQQRVGGTDTADWLKTTYPTAEELDELRTHVEQLPAAQSQLRDAEHRANEWGLLKGREANLVQSLARLQAELPRQPLDLRTAHADLEAEEKALVQSLEARRGLRQQTQRELEQFGQQRERIQRALAQCQGQIQTEAKQEQNCQAAVAKFARDLPEHWKAAVTEAGLSQLNDWTHERDEMQARDTEQRAQELRQARQTFDGLRREATALEKQLGDFPEQARQGLAAVQQLSQEARKVYRLREEDFHQARKTFDRLEDQNRRHQDLLEQSKRIDASRKRWKDLAELLGRERLQLDLVRKAERQVVHHANAVLDRLSGGELYLRLSGQAGGEENSDKALDLEAHNRVTGEKPINVAFLSGSQKFRVAVSLALGLGQYASRQHRPIESVIIDEGFGCLDRNARQVMIQELQNLRSQMRCILLVSHQEEFAEAFADGYHFELQNGTTVARRFQR